MGGLLALHGGVFHHLLPDDLALRFLDGLAVHDGDDGLVEFNRRRCVRCDRVARLGGWLATLLRTLALAVSL
jgi:hypothetical protein